MLVRRLCQISTALLLGIVLTPAAGLWAQEKAPAAAPQTKPTIGKVCANCHQPQPGSLRGNFDSVAYKSQMIQMKIDETTEVLKFDKASLKVANLQNPDNPEEPLRALKKGKEIRVEFTEKDGVKIASLVSAKPAIKVPAEKQLKTAEVEKLVALGPEKGKYLLIDARPAPRFMEGTIPTAINIPFAAFDKMTDKLPKEKDALIVYFCAGET